MPKMLAVAVLALGTLLAGCSARAQEGAWCAYGGGRNDYQDCGYYTLQQCVDSVRGLGGACRPNPRGGYGPRYGGPPGYDDVPPPPGRRRRY